MTIAYLARLLAAAGVAECAEAEFRQYAERRIEIMTAARVRAHNPDRDLRLALIDDQTVSLRLRYG